MKIKYLSIVGILAILVLVASFVVPAKLAMPEPVAANPGLMEWTSVDTPDTEINQIKALYSPIVNSTEGGSELIKLLVGNNGQTMYAIVAREVGNRATQSVVRFLKSFDGGISWSFGICYNNLDAVVGAAGGDDAIVWDMAIAPDDPNFIIAAVSFASATLADQETQAVYVSSDGGANWQNTQWPPVGGPTIGTAFISAMDISMDYGGGRDILVATRSGASDTNNIWTMKVPGFGGWNSQSVAPSTALLGNVDALAAKFSPTYNGDSTIVVVYSNTVGTYLVTGVRDIAQNFTNWGAGIPIMRSSDVVANTPTATQIVSADLELPSDFSGQSSSLRRFYVSIDAGNVTTLTDGVFRIDDTTVYTLMDTTTTTGKRVASIAYWGTYASGKLLVGERIGQSCKAAVPVWFTDSPTVCPVPCWYPAKKPPSGAAGQTNCTGTTQGYGNSYVVWSPTYAAQGVAYAVTGSSSWGVYHHPIGANQAAAINWPDGIFHVFPLDESAFSLTRNNGETWNQLALIDTRMIKLTDVAPAADCTTVYLASVNDGANCAGFDSVWRSSTNEKVVAPPLRALPIGMIWERVRVSPTALSCNATQSDYAILRLAPDKLDGQVIGWAAGGATALAQGGFPTGANTRAMAWSPDFGDYWADINPRITVQDFAFESSTILYVLSENGNVQKLPYTGTAWSNAINTVSAGTGTGHTIEAVAKDKVLVAASAAGSLPASISINSATSFTPMVRPIPTTAQIGYHAIFDTDFNENATIYIGSDGNASGLIYRNTAPDGSNNQWGDMMTGTTTHVEYYGLVQTNSKNVIGEGALYAAHDAFAPATWSGVERTLGPLAGKLTPRVWWDCLDASATPYQAQNPLFTLEPKSLKMCGCLTQDTNTTLYAIDNDFYSNQQNVEAGGRVVVNVRTLGLLWEYTDCMAKNGPKPTMDDGAIIGCDPATGRNQEVNFTWEQLCIADTYQLLIAKDPAFTLMVWGIRPDGGYYSFAPARLTSPAFIYLSGGEGTVPAILDANGRPLSAPSLECGHTYYWKVKVYNETTNDGVTSPWSDYRSFTIKAGFRVTTPYYGPQLLVPANSCGCACNAPISFSWSPFKETQEYKFELSENADMSSPLVTTTVTTTAYQYTGTVKCNKSYFWRIMATQPAPSEWSAVFSFMTQPEPPKPASPVPEPGTPLWAWTLIAIGTILVIVTLVLVVKTRKTL